jgi:hypothetical protein
MSDFKSTSQGRSLLLNLIFYAVHIVRIVVWKK